MLSQKWEICKQYSSKVDDYFQFQMPDYDDLVSKIKQAASPTTKKQLRSFLGLVGYYRDCVPSFAAIAVPLSDLTKKGTPEKLVWTDVQEQAFQTLKRHVCVQPVLRLPDMTIWIVGLWKYSTGYFNTGGLTAQLLPNSLPVCLTVLMVMNSQYTESVFTKYTGRPSNIRNMLQVHNCVFNSSTIQPLSNKPQQFSLE